MTQLASKKLQLAVNGIRFNTFRATPEIDTPIEEISKDRHYWAHVSAMLAPGDIIQAIPEDFGYIAELLVIDAGKLYANVRLISYKRFTEEHVAIPDGYDVKWRGKDAKYVVCHGKLSLKDGFADRASAAEWLKKNAIEELPAVV